MTTIVNPLQIDPTRTTMLRKAWIADCTRRFARLKQNVVELIKHRNALGLTLNTTWQYLTDAQKLEQFRLWLQNQIEQHALSQGQADSWLKEYVAKAYKQGLGRGYDQVRKPAIAQKIEVYQGGRKEFIRLSFSNKSVLDKLDTLTTRTESELKGVTDTVAQQALRELADGLNQQDSPDEIAKRIVDRIDTIGIARAKTLVRSETTRFHAEGQLDAYESLGLDEVGIAVEWTTKAGNADFDEQLTMGVCPKCADLAGIVLAIDEARGLLPRHGNCRCSFTPANVGEETTDQVRTRSRIVAAIKRSRSKGKDKWKPNPIHRRRPSLK